MSHPGLVELFQLMEDLGGSPVVLRGFAKLPDRIDGDVDVLLRPAAIESLSRELQARGFRKKLGRGRRISGATPHRKFDRSGLRLDVVEALCYRSPYDRRRPWVAADPQLGEWLFERRRPHESGAFQVPADVDLFAHLLCHCCFDKRAFEPQYRASLAGLAAGLDDSELEPVLARCFFRVWRPVLALVREAAFDRLVDSRWMSGY